ncbi:MAG: methylated-DNA--[protein]-cysteine S-methyltransferase [Pseudomonadota bacterium]
MHYQLFETAFGICGIAWRDTGLTRILLPEGTREHTQARIERFGANAWRGALPPNALHAEAALKAYFEGEGETFDTITLDAGASQPFHGDIYWLLRQVPRGETVTYGELARRAGQPGAARAVGMAMGRNPWPIIVPCHRVLASGGKLGGFSAHGGTMTKERLLALEGVIVGDPLLPGLF